jgi:adenine-specific DNA-methyltransferase
MTKKTRLELTWVGKENRPQLEPRILLEDPALSYHAPHRVTDNDQFDNLLIQGDNLLALKALEADYTGKVKCVFIDPPYNTGSAFTHYDDGIEHSLWLSLMRDRLEIIRTLLSENGSLWITLDDNEHAYCKVMCDEIFGRRNFVANVVWQKRTSPDARATLGAAQDYVLVYAKDILSFKPVLNKLALSDSQANNFRNPDNDPKGPWASTDFTGQTGHATESQFYTIKAPNGKLHPPPPGRCWALAERNFYRLVEEGRVHFGSDGNARPRLKRYLSEAGGVNAWTWWPNTEVGHNQEAKKEILDLFGPDLIFDTPKPERLLHRILTLATNPGDLVLDSFAGSGTTGAVAQKMSRRWIMIELGEQAKTHIVPRLRKVLDGQDPGGITKIVEWQGGGGFRFYTLAPSLLTKDRWDNWIINKEYNPEMLTEALCKLHGFRYSPNPEVFWQQGHSTETDYLYVTTATLTHAQLEKLSEEVGADRTLLVLCPAFKGNAPFANLTVKKIPKHVLHRCEWGHDDYSLRVENLPQAPPQLGQQVLAF